MKKVIFAGLYLFFCFFPVLSLATWQIADPYHGTRIDQKWLPERITVSDIPNQYAGRKLTVSFKKGLLKKVIENAAYENHWLIQWNAPENYPLLLDTTLVGSSFPSVINKLLIHYPLKANYNRAAKIMTISPAKSPARTKK